MSLAVLIVDGHPRVREALAERLRRAPQVTLVLAAASLEEAVACVERHAPRVVLCVPLGLGDAMEAVRRLASTGAPLVALVASIEESAAEALRSAGARAVLLKGMATGALLRHLKDAAAERDMPADRLRGAPV